jgi:hypothetical protein
MKGVKKIVLPLLLMAAMIVASLSGCAQSFPKMEVYTADSVMHGTDDDLTLSIEHFVIHVGRPDSLHYNLEFESKKRHLFASTDSLFTSGVADSGYYYFVYFAHDPHNEKTKVIIGLLYQAGELLEIVVRDGMGIVVFNIEAAKHSL